jgi:D-threonate/D-erythronate kinase
LTQLLLLADDLTGALDSAARFVGRFGPVPVAWQHDPAAQVLALDSATRDLPRDEARQRAAKFAPALARAAIAFKKIDSLLRGHVAAEVEACAAGGGFNAVVIAPAFPAQGRITRHGRQLAHGSDVGVDLIADFAHAGIPISQRSPGDDLPPGVSLWDAESDADLARIAAMARGRVLWVGSGGLAGALGATAVLRLSARRAEAVASGVLALVGSDHPVAAAQLAGCSVRLTLSGTDDATNPAHGAAIDVAVPPGSHRQAAAQLIAAAFAALLRRIERPGTLIVTGGATLRGVCVALSASGLLVEGELAPGIPVARLIGGSWDGLRIVSKSGAFGDAGLLARLLSGDATP